MDKKSSNSWKVLMSSANGRCR